MEYNPFYRKPYYYYAQNKYAQNSGKGTQNTYAPQRNVQANVGAHSVRPHFEEPTRASVGAKKQIQTKSPTPKENKPIFEIFGLKLYFDDILIIALLFFLYEEGVEDNLLFISLILLLLS